MAYEEHDGARLPHGPGVSSASEVATESAPDPAETNRRSQRLTFLRELIETVLLTLVIFVAVRTLVVNFRVDGSSMQPNLADGQYLLVNKAVYFHLDLNTLKNLLPGPDRQGQDIVYLFHLPQRGDIIVFDPPLSTRSDRPFVKRVIGLPGDTVATRDGKIFVNGQALAEPYIPDPAGLAFRFGANGSGNEVVVPAGSLFVLGDNRNNSQDSRYFGTVALDRVIGKAVVSYWPPDDIGLIPHQRYANADAGE